MAEIIPCVWQISYGSFSHGTPDKGITTTERLSSGGFKVTMVGISGLGYVDCGSETNCELTGLHMKSLVLEQDLRIFIGPIDTDTGRDTQGRTRGRFTIPLPNGNTREVQFKGEMIVEV